MYKKDVIKSVISEMFASRITETKKEDEALGITDENPTKAPNWTSKKEGDKKASFSGLYKRVQNKLKDDRINHAAIILTIQRSS